MIVEVLTDDDCECVLKKAAEKLYKENTNLPEASFVLLYPDLTRVVNVPGSDKIFSVVVHVKTLNVFELDFLLSHSVN